MEFNGYVRKDGKVGVRNHVLIMPISHIANHVVMQVSKNVKGTVYFRHQHGINQRGDDLLQTKRVLYGFAAHPNVFGIVIVGSGKELINLQDIAAHGEKHHKVVETINISQEGGLNSSIKKGIDLAKNVLKASHSVERTPTSISNIIFSTECGGSDALSGISANPAVGKCSDLLVEHGGTSILSETMELVGAEHLLAQRAINKVVEAKLYEAIRHTEETAMNVGVDIRGTQPARGNIEGGITTIEEKSLGCIWKGGTSPLVDVIGYAEYPEKKGLNMMDAPGQDIEQLTGMVAGGSQIAAFTTGRGTPAGSPIAPVIKIATNSPMYNKMKYNMDLNAGEIVTGDKTVDELGEELFEMLVDVSNGKQTRSEILNHNEFGIFSIGKSI